MTIWRAFLEIAPAAKARPRVTRRGTYMPDAYMKWREKFCWLVKKAGMPQRHLRERIGILMRVQTKTGTMRPDLDNALAGALDALQDAGVIGNDRNVIKLEAVLCQSKEVGIYLELSDGWVETVL